MIGRGEIDVRCPVCEAPIAIPVTFTLKPRTADTPTGTAEAVVMADVEAVGDSEPVRAHITEHHPNADQPGTAP